MIDWIFEMTKSGELVPFKLKAEEEWAEREEQSDYLRRIGFDTSREDYLGDLQGNHLVWHERNKGNSHQYIVSGKTSTDSA